MFGAKRRIERSRSPLESGSLSDLMSRLRATARDGNSRPLAILAGSGLTSGSVPGVNEILNSVRNALDPLDRPDLDSKLKEAKDDSEKYQSAFTFLSLRQPPGVRDRLIQLATLKAYKGTTIRNHGDLTSTKLMEYEADTDHWSLPAGVAALGRIWAGLPTRLRGPILTTNFDPLCEIAIKRAGFAASPRIVDADGSFLADIRATDVPQVVHMHGYWRESTTLSMTSQLLLPRPALNGSLRALLSQYTLVVVGYGAWRDALTLQLSEIIKEQSARDLDVLWCFYGNHSELERRLANDETFAQMLLAPGNLQFYSEIDANIALPKIETALASFLDYSDSPRLSKGRGSLLGWRPVAPMEDPQSGQGAAAAALKFFDGRLPNWLDAASGMIPRRDIVYTMKNEFSALLVSRQSSITVLLGASGEGKTTALMQVALVLAAERRELVVLYGSDGRISSVDEILALPGDVDHLLILDDAHRSIDRLRELSIRIQESGRLRLHLLVASRDSDWSSVGGFNFAWNRYVEMKVHRLRGINRPDASALVRAWEALGPRALGSLVSVTGTEARITALMNAAAGEKEAEEGAFLGALLATRYGAGLVEHIRVLLLQLSDRPVHVLHSECDDSLLDAVALIAIPHALGVRALDEEVLASAMGITAQELFGSVLLPLGDEAAISFSVSSVLVRHRLIAESVVDLAPQLGVDLEALVARLVTAAVEAVDRLGPHRPAMKLAYLSQSLREPALSVAAARAAVAASPNRLSYRTSLSRALRMAREPLLAATECEQALVIVSGATDSATGTRPFFTEWGVAEGNLGNWARNAVLASIALQDMGGSNLSLERTTLVTLNCLALSFRRLYERHSDFVYLAGLSSVVEIADNLPLPSADKAWMREAEDFVFAHGGAPPRDLPAACRDLTEACKRAYAQLENSLPSATPRRGFSFSHLVTAR